MMAEWKGMSSSPARTLKLQLIVYKHRQEDARTHQKKIPCVQRHKKLQGDNRRCIITIKSNPILTGWATHKLENNKTKEVLPLL